VPTPRQDRKDKQEQEPRGGEEREWGQHCVITLRVATQGENSAISLIFFLEAIHILNVLEVSLSLY